MSQLRRSAVVDGADRTLDVHPHRRRRRSRRARGTSPRRRTRGDCPAGSALPAPRRRDRPGRDQGDCDRQTAPPPTSVELPEPGALLTDRPQGALGPGWPTGSRDRAFRGRRFAGYSIERRLGRGGMGSLPGDRARAGAACRAEADRAGGRADEVFASASPRSRGSPRRSSTPTWSRSTRPARRGACPSSRCATSTAPTSPDAGPRGAARARRAATDRPGRQRPRRDPRRRAGPPRRQAGQRAAQRRRGGEHAYLTDFGVARNVATESGLTQTGRFVGTLDYVAPEQISGGAVDARADVYALGCLLFKLLTGDVPFPKEGEAARLYAHLHDPPPAPSLNVAGSDGARRRGDPGDVEDPGGPLSLGR